MNSTRLAALCLLPALLAGCSQIARSAADNRPVDVLHLGAVPFTGTVRALPAAQGVRAQADSDTDLTYSNPSVGDFDTSSIPGIVGNPSRVDVDLAFETAQFQACGTLPDSFSVTVTRFQVLAADAVHGSASADQPLNARLDLTRSAPGSDTYTVKFGGATAAIFGTLAAGWDKFGPIFTKSGAESPNSVTATATVHADNLPVGCLLKFVTPENLVQRVRFQ